MTNVPEQPPLLEAGRIRRLQYRWVQQPWLDLLLATGAVAVWLLLGWRGWVPLALTEVQFDARRSVFQVVATLSGTMAGFTLTSVSVLVNLLKTPLGALDRLLPAAEKRSVGSVVLKVLPRLAFTLVAAMVALLVETSPTVGYWWLQAIVVGGVAASMFSLARVVWVLRRLLILST